MKKLLLFLFLITPFFSEAQLSTGTIQHDGNTRDYSIYIPANYNSSTSAPLVLNFHGFGGVDSNQMKMSNFQPIADTAGFIVVAPTGTPLPLVNLNHWNVGGWTNTSTTDDVSFASALIDSVAAQYNIDMNRVYSTGFSNGGFFSHKLACELNHRIAAIASVSGTFTPQMQSSCTPGASIPVMQIHGTTDAVVPYNGTAANGGMAAVDTVIEYWTNFNNTSSTPQITNLPDIDPNDGSTVEHFVYAGLNNGPNVELLKITGAGHTWPGNSGNKDINASLEIWKFFSRHTNYPVGIHEITKANNIDVYPNPTNGFLTISAPDLLERIEIFNPLGELILRKKLNTQKTTILLENIPSGNYIYKVQSASGILTGLIFKN